MTRKLTQLALVLSLASLPACQVVATHAETNTWRATRREADERQRLLLLAEYVRDYPTGAWATAAAAERAEAEESVWSTSNGTVDGLNYYLEAYPDGTYVEQAHARVSAMSVVAERVEVEEEHVEEVEAAAAEEASVTRRMWVGRAMEFWTRTLMGIRNYGSPISAVARANPEFSEAFGRAPEPVCDSTHCLKHYHSNYAVPNPGGTRIERDIELFMRIQLGERGRVRRVEVLIPNRGFSRWYELENRALVIDEDPAARMAAIEWALGRIEPIVAELGAGGHAVDVIPDPIIPVSGAESAASEVEEDAADEIPGETHVEAPATSGGDDGSGSTLDESTGSSSLDDLLAAATGGLGTGDETSGEEVAPVEEYPTETLAFPLGLRALEIRNYRIVIFAAADEDTGAAYDGFYIELAE